MSVNHLITPFETIDIETRPFIGGKFMPPQESHTILKYCPANGQPLPALHGCGKKDIDYAFEQAQKVYENKAWRSLSLQERREVLLKWSALIRQNLNELAYLDTLETGRAMQNFLEDSIPKALEALIWFAESVDKSFEHFIKPASHSWATLSREPLGVIGLITPWNDPLVVSMWKLAPALLMGNSILMKPAEQSSYSILRVAALAQEAGLPDGVLNILPGQGTITGQLLAKHKGIRGIFFTGSSETGKLILQAAGLSNMKKVGLECGGKSAMLVSKNSKKIKLAAETLAQNIFYNQGQICSAPSRVILDAKIKEEFLHHLLKQVPQYLPGNPFNPQNKIGGVVSQKQKQRIENYIQAGLNAGAVRLTSTDYTLPDPNGAYIIPTIFDQVPTDTQIACEEIFGPVLCVFTCNQVLKDGIHLANKLNYGLAAAIWSDDLDEAMQGAASLEAGIVHINSYGADNNTVPFGGIKESGIGKDKSIMAFDEYSYLKTTWLELSQSNIGSL